MKKFLFVLILLMNYAQATHVIFDIDALFKVDEMGSLSKVPFLGSIGKDMAKKYTKIYLELLGKLDFEKELLNSGMTFRGVKVPALMCSYFLGKTESKKAKILAETLIDKIYWFPSFEKMAMQEAASVGFAPEKQVKSLKPVKRLVALAEHLSRNPNFEIFIFSNKNNETINELKKSFSDIFKLFGDRICTSADLYIMKNLEVSNAMCLKPNPRAYAQFLLNYNLNPADCYFIEQEENCLQTVKSLGARGCCWSKDTALEIDNDLNLGRES